MSSVMPLSSYRMHRIYLAATMNYGLGSDDPEELAYYNKIRNEMDNMKKEPVKKGIPLNWDSSKLVHHSLINIPPSRIGMVPTHIAIPRRAFFSRH